VDYQSSTLKKSAKISHVQLSEEDAERIFQVLAADPAFHEHISEQVLRNFIAQSNVVEVPEGSEIFTENKTATFAALILSGGVLVRDRACDVKAGPGALIGLDHMLNDDIVSNVTAMAYQSKVLYLNLTRRAYVAAVQATEFEGSRAAGVVEVEEDDF
jgi:glucose-6-phosphate 1-dehydrogenase